MAYTNRIKKIVSYEAWRNIDWRPSIEFALISKVLFFFCDQLI